MRRFAFLLFAIALAAMAVPETQAQTLDGARLYQQRCGGCHSVDANRIGPLHRGLVGRRAGSVVGFRYSPALSQANFVWTAARLDRWLRDPRAMVPGTRMGFRLANAAQRQAIIEYLATQE